MDGTLGLTDQVGAAFTPAHVWIDDEGGILFSDDAAPARVAALYDHDLELFANHAALDDAGKSGVFHWRAGVELPVSTIARAEVAKRFGFISSPAARAASAG
ncbi:ABC-type multidrug transport system, ATPase and permease component [Candidatus Paraburkholderia kirkii]|nr:ABC-type multidrug transport system, ATPase and permease component [Candidatus Paraburkholderia kirkii]